MKAYLICFAYDDHFYEVHYNIASKNIYFNKDMAMEKLREISAKRMKKELEHIENCRKERLDGSTRLWGEAIEKWMKYYDAREKEIREMWTQEIIVTYEELSEEFGGPNIGYFLLEMDCE